MHYLYTYFEIKGSVTEFLKCSPFVILSLWLNHLPLQMLNEIKRG